LLVNKLKPLPIYYLLTNNLKQPTYEQFTLHFSSDSCHSMGYRISYNAYGGIDSCPFSHGGDRNII
jgi:hypothetical protein